MKTTFPGLILLLAMVCRTMAAGATNMVSAIDGDASGQVFEGLGALSAGASSRLLIDYPEPQRSQVLDFLFKPRFGASLHHLKVEIGGDTQSTDGTEPSHARTREEFLNPKREYFQRGYEWFLMNEARQRNAGIYLDVLQWGAPGWVGDILEPALRLRGYAGGQLDAKKFYSQDNADYITSFIKGAKKYHGLNIDYCGIWNERKHDVAWVKKLRATLDREGLQSVKVVAADGCCGFEWDIIKDLAKDDQLLSSVKIIGAHYPASKSPEEARPLGLPLWSSEDGFWDKTTDPWEAARILARMYNRNYVQGRMTKTIVWSLITSYFGNLPLPGSGLMTANQPWSGHYATQPAIWVTAHTTQFAQPGWQYLDSACVLLPGGGSQAVLRNTNGDFSIIVETIDANAPQTVTYQLGGGLAAKKLHLWRTTQKEQFVQLPDISLETNSFTLTLEPEALYSFTTTTGQCKGTFKDVPPAANLSLPYSENFEDRKPGSAPKYFTDQAGVFEIASRADGQGRCLRQVVSTKTIEWSEMQWPVTLVGSEAWTNYEVSCSAKVSRGGVVRLMARANRHLQDQGSGYALSIGLDGYWSLFAIPEGEAFGSGAIEIATNAWHTLALRCHGPVITAFVDGKQVARACSLLHQSGMVGVAAGGWYEADFDNLRVTPITEPAPKLQNLALQARLSASSTWNNEFEASSANDGKPNTRWNAGKGCLTNQWLELDFGKKVRVDTVIIQQIDARIVQYALQAFDGSQWRNVLYRERRKQSAWADSFQRMQTAKLRLVILGTAGNNLEFDTPSICEIEAYDTSSISPDL